MKSCFLSVRRPLLHDSHFGKRFETVSSFV